LAAWQAGGLITPNDHVDIKRINLDENVAAVSSGKSEFARNAAKAAR
jgi:hypothetical protein